jgi:hypothetical protein
VRRRNDEKLRVLETTVLSIDKPTNDETAENLAWTEKVSNQIKELKNYFNRINCESEEYRIALSNMQNGLERHKIMQQIRSKANEVAFSVAAIRAEADNSKDELGQYKLRVKELKTELIRVDDAKPPILFPGATEAVQNLEQDVRNIKALIETVQDTVTQKEQEIEKSCRNRDLQLQNKLQSQLKQIAANLHYIKITISSDFDQIGKTLEHSQKELQEMRTSLDPLGVKIENHDSLLDLWKSCDDTIEQQTQFLTTMKKLFGFQQRIQSANDEVGLLDSAPTNYAALLAQDDCKKQLELALERFDKLSQEISKYENSCSQFQTDCAELRRSAPQMEALLEIDGLVSSLSTKVSEIALATKQEIDKITWCQAFLEDFGFMKEKLERLQKISSTFENKALFSLNATSVNVEPFDEEILREFEGLKKWFQEASIVPNEDTKSMVEDLLNKAQIIISRIELRCEEAKILQQAFFNTIQISKQLNSLDEEIRSMKLSREGGKHFTISHNI